MELWNYKEMECWNVGLMEYYDADAHYILFRNFNV